MKVRKFKLRPVSRVVGKKTFTWACKNMPKSKRGWYIVRVEEEGYDEHNCWESWVIVRFK